jgi:hypothetical protein
MQSNTPVVTESKAMLWTGKILSGLMALFFVFDGVGHLMKPAPVVEAFARLGYPLSASVGIGMLALICTAIYVTPRTSVLGAILLTGYMGGAVSTCASWLYAVRDDLSSDPGRAGVAWNLCARCRVA